MQGREREQGRGVSGSFGSSVKHCSGSKPSRDVNSSTAEGRFWGCTISTSPALWLYRGRGGEGRGGEGRGGEGRGGEGRGGEGREGWREALTRMLSVCVG